MNGCDTRPRRSLVVPLALMLASASLVACGADEEKSGSSPSGEDGPLYAMMIQVYGEEDRTVYTHLTNSLDFGPQVDLTKAREFPGPANFAAVDGRLLISSGIEPTITEFHIANDLSWREGRTVSFVAFPHEDNANFYAQFFLSDSVAYLPYDGTKRLIWNPLDMAINETREDSQLPLEKNGLKLTLGGNRNGIRFKGPVRNAFYYTDDDYFETSPESTVAIYDEKTHAEKSLVTLPCPAATMASQDEDGYTYYGTWGSQATRALFGLGAPPCIARLKPDLTLDTAWTTDLKDMTEGRYHNNFRYIGKGMAIANVLHHELIQANWAGGYNADVADQIDKSGPHWRLWLFDLKARKAKPIEGIDVATSSGAQFTVLDGRTFVFLPYEDWGRTKIYELDKDGRATVHSDTAGDVFKWIRVR